MEKIVEHSQIGTVIYCKNKRSKTIRVSIRKGGAVHVSLPVYCKYSQAQQFVESNISKIKMLQQRMEEKTSSRIKVNDLDKTAQKELAKRAKAILLPMLQDLSGKMNQQVKVKNVLGFTKTNPFSYNKVFLKNNVSNWGSCSVRRNINLNINLVNLPEPLIKYVMLHELCHLVHMNHGPKFHELLNSVCGGREKELSKALNSYTLR